MPSFFITRIPTCILHSPNFFGKGKIYFERVNILLTSFFNSFGGEEYLHVRKELNGHFSGPITGGH